jgi:predicted kinase
LIVVDNTNTTVAEMAPYMAVAAAYGHDTKVVTIDCDPEVAAARNVHGVPVQTVKAQHDRIVKETKNMPPWWSHEVHLHESRLGEV